LNTAGASAPASLAAAGNTPPDEIESVSMNINVAPFARQHFWEEPPPGSEEFWAFRFPPPCKVGDPLVFRFDGAPVARAVVSRIEQPGRTRCDGTGRFSSTWNVFWTPESFEDLRQTQAKVEPRDAAAEAAQFPLF
jgi:hypothetical protein